jgi:NitT/TauT family transport system substrate-binding protein
VPPQQQPGLTGIGKLFVFMVVAVLMYLGFTFVTKRGTTNGPSHTASTTGGTSTVSGSGTETPGGGSEEPAGAPGQVTVQSDYKYVPQERLPAVKGTSGYTWDAKQRIVEFPINVWIGWLPIVAANHGFSPNEESIFYKKYKFKVKLNLVDDPVQARDGYASGKYPVLWGTLDMMVLFADELMKDSRTAPRIFQQVDWSNGGDGIVVREAIKTVADLKGKTVVYAQNSPSQYYFNSLLISGGLSPDDVKVKLTNTAFEASAAFDSDKSIDACVSWAPDIYNLVEKRKGNRLLSTTQEANKLIADVYAVRADFAKDHPDIVYGLAAGIFEGMQMTKDKKSATFSQAATWMAEGYSMKPEDIMAMANDAHTTNFAENVEFFVNANSPTNFERSWKSISYVYKELGLIRGTVQFDQVMDYSVVKKLAGEGKFKDHKNENTTTFAPTTYSKVSAENPIVTAVIQIQFYPNSWNLHEPAHNDTGGVVQGSLYDPNVNAVIERAAKLAGQFSNARIAIVGHTDGSRKGQIDAAVVRDLSLKRANAVKEELVKKYKFDANKFVVEGKGWDAPADPADPDNHFKNRRVEVSVYQAEAQP